MKLGLLLLSGFLSTFDPGCGAGANVANDGTQGSSGGTSSSSSGGSGGVGEAHGSGMTCGALGAHTFCEDFGGSSMLGAFDDPATQNGTLALDESETVSPPNALLATTVHATNTTRTQARLEKKLVDAGTHFTLAYAEYVDPTCIGPNDAVETGTIGFESNGYWIAVRHANPDQVLEAGLRGGAYVQAHELKSSMPRGKWTHIVLDVDLSRNVIGLKVDGETIVADEPLKYPPAGGQVPNIAVGTLTDNLAWSPSACQVRIDDVTFDEER